MEVITLFKFNLIQNGHPNSILGPKGYIFRGIFMNWLSQLNQSLIKHLHQKQPLSTPQYTIKYALQQDVTQKIFHRNNKSLNELYIKNLLFSINSYNSKISQTLVQYLLQQQNQTIKYGQSQAFISQIEIKQVYLHNIIDTSVPLSSFKLDFITPTAYNQMGSHNELRLPLPSAIFGNLIKHWNAIFQGTSNAISNEFFHWMEKNLFVASHKIHTKTWDIGKKHKFVGFTGYVSFIIKEKREREPNLKFRKILYWLIHLGEYTNTGMHRTAGCGQFKLINYQELKEKVN